MLIHQSNNLDFGSLTPTQKLVLQAAFLPEQVAISAWHQWLETVDIEDQDSESYHLFPFIYRNLANSQLDISEIVRIKGVYKRRWFENQIIFSKLTDILSLFQDAGLKTLLLKDTALATYYCSDNGCPSLYKLDILIHPSELYSAITLLRNIGWIPKSNISDALICFSQSLEFQDNSQYPLTLHWHLFPSAFQDHTDDEFWQRAMTTKVGEVSTYILEPTDQFLSLGLQVYFWTSILPLRLISGATIIINSSGSDIDWNRLLIQAQKYRLVLPLKNLLKQLYDSLDAPIPASILEKVNHLTMSRFEWFELKINTGKKIPIIGTFLVRYFQYLRLVNNADLKAKLLGFPRFLQ